MSKLNKQTHTHYSTLFKVFD